MTDYTNRIISLDREQWQGHKLAFHYISHNYYDVEINRSDGRFDVSFTKKSYDTPFSSMNRSNSVKIAFSKSASR